MCDRTAGLISLLRTGAKLEKTYKIHSLAITSGLAVATHLYSALISAYARAGAANHAFLLASSSLSSAGARLAGFTSLISVASRGPDPLLSLSFFSSLRRLHLRPNKFTFSATFPACAAAEALSAGEQLHTLALRHGLLAEPFVSSAAIDMYGKCHQPHLARRLFDEIPERRASTWNALLVNLHEHQAQAFFREMLAETSPEEVSFSAALCSAAACGAASAAFGMQVHAAALKLGADSAMYVTNALIDMYSKCTGDTSAAAAIFSTAAGRDTISWNSFAAGLLCHGEFERAASCFCATVIPDEASFSTALHAAAAMAAPSLGSALHAQSLRHGLSSSATVTSSLISMYAKCGDLGAAAAVFSVAESSTGVWSAMIVAFKLHGQAQKSVELFEEMMAFGLQPDYTTFVSVLSACSHGGLVEKGLEIFRGITEPQKEHYSCMVDMLGRAGRMAEARAFIAVMPAAEEEKVSTWGALLGASSFHGDIEMGEEAARRLFEIEPENSGNYIILSNMYRRQGKEAEAEEVRREMGIRGVRKETSCSWIDVLGGGTEVFRVWEREHCRSPEIHRMLAALRAQVRKRRKMEEKEEEDEKLWGHSERIALAFGLLSLPEEMPMRIKKNLRTCIDCHEVFKAASEIFRRVILLRDTNRFHRFEAGVCSCGDYW